MRPVPNLPHFSLENVYFSENVLWKTFHWKIEYQRLILPRTYDTMKLIVLSIENTLQMKPVQRIAYFAIKTVLLGEGGVIQFIRYSHTFYLFAIAAVGKPALIYQQQTRYIKLR